MPLNDEELHERMDAITHRALAAAIELLGSLDLTDRERVLAFSVTSELYQVASRVYEIDREVSHHVVAAALAAALSFASEVERGVDDLPL